MKIGIIGTGRMAQNLAIGWGRAGHTVQLGSRSPAGKEAEGAEVSIGGVADTVAMAEVVLIAIPFPSVKEFAAAYAEQLRPKLIIDITNPFDHLPDNRLGAQEITAQAIGAGARVVATFKANFWTTLLEPVDPATGLVRDVHFAGDSEEDKAIVTRLIEDLGFKPVDCGPLRNGRILDGMVPLIIELQGRYGGENPPYFSWKLLG